MTQSRSLLAGLIGAKIQHSLAPTLFEDGCAAAGLRGHYHLMDLDFLPGRTLADLLGAARTAGFVGVNVTFPCKEAVLPLLNGLSDEARQIGAVNTVTIARDGRTMGYNTDCIGFRRSVEENFGAASVRDARLLMVGAGGAGRAVAFALLGLGAGELLVADQNAGQANGVAEAVGRVFGRGRCRVVTDPAAEIAGVTGIVNATPVGMSGVPGVPLAVDGIGASHWVADVIYSPLETVFLTSAKARGARTMGGADMCIHQAAEGFRLFTGASADTQRLRRTFEAAAARRSVEPAAAN